jgi:hypothetical protein
MDGNRRWQPIRSAALAAASDGQVAATLVTVLSYRYIVAGPDSLHER